MKKDDLRKTFLHFFQIIYQRSAPESEYDPTILYFVSLTLPIDIKRENACSTLAMGNISYINWRPKILATTETGRQ